MSGDFERDSLGKIPPLVGGVLVPKYLDEKKGTEDLDGKPIHSTEIRGSEYGEKALPVLQKIVTVNFWLFLRIRKGLV